LMLMTVALIAGLVTRPTNVPAPQAH
jgi:hypothetical protein